MAATNDVSKLPPMPTDAQILEFGAQWGDNRRIVYYRARMEALVGYVQHHFDCLKDESEYNDGPWPCTCALDALLAACERRQPT